MLTYVETHQNTLAGFQEVYQTEQCMQLRFPAAKLQKTAFHNNSGSQKFLESEIWSL